MCNRQCPIFDAQVGGAKHLDIGYSLLDIGHSIGSWEHEWQEVSKS
jgi:hypothetical protein